MSLRPLVLPALLLALLWAPFAYVTLFNPSSATRLGQAALRAESWGAWLSAWWAGYRVYFWPDFYYRYGDGSSIRGVPGFGVELWATLPLVLLGLAGIIFRIVRPPRPNTQDPTPIFILGALLIAALPVSLTTPSPHTYRAAPLAPLYALLVGYGAAFLTRWQGDKVTRWHGGTIKPDTSFEGEGETSQNVTVSPPHRVTVSLSWLIALTLSGALLWQGLGWWRAYTQEYPAQQAALNQDGLAEAVRRAVELAPQYDEVWVSYDSIDQPYLFVLAARPFPPDEAQRLIEVERRPNRFNAVTGLGPYRFMDTSGLPLELPTLAAVPGAAGGPGYLVQELAEGGRRVLVVRAMR